MGKKILFDSRNKLNLEENGFEARDEKHPDKFSIKNKIHKKNKSSNRQKEYKLNSSGYEHSNYNHIYCITNEKKDLKNKERINDSNLKEKKRFEIHNEISEYSKYLNKKRNLLKKQKNYSQKILFQKRLPEIQITFSELIKKVSVLTKSNKLNAK